MNKSTVIVIVALFVAIVIGMFGYAYMKQNSPTPEPVVEVPKEKPGEITRIDAKHYYTESVGVHTVAGELLMPTPCDLIDTKTVLLDNGTRAVISFDVINNSGGTCEEKPTVQRFKAGFKAPKDIKIEATYKGNPVILNLIEAGPNEKPGDFELFLKG